MGEFVVVFASSQALSLAGAKSYWLPANTGVEPDNSFRPSPHRYDHERTVDRAGRLNSGVRPMSHNSYSQPTTPLPIPPHSTRPATVAIAGWLFGVSYAIGLGIAITKVGIPKTPPIIMGLLLGLFVSAGMLLAICSRRNWGRWLVVILIALNFLVLPDLISRNADAIQVLYAAQGVLQLASAILILMPASNRWYRPNNSFKSSPHQGGA